MTLYWKRSQVVWIALVLAPMMAGCLGFQPPTQDRKGYFQKKEYIFRSLELQLNLLEKRPILLADVTIDNPTNYSIESLQLTCVEMSRGGNHVGEHSPVLNQMVKEKSSQTVRNIRVGSPHSQFETLQCDVTDFEIVGAQPSSVSSTAGPVQKGDTKSGEMEMRSKEATFQEEKPLPASTSVPLPERSAREGKELPDSVSKPTANQLSSQQKADLVLRLLRGESLESVSRDSRVSVYDLENWQQIFLEEGRQGLEKTK